MICLVPNQISKVCGGTPQILQNATLFTSVHVNATLVIPPVVNEDDGHTHLVQLVLVVPDVLLLLGGRGLDVQVVPRPREDLPP